MDCDFWSLTLSDLLMAAPAIFIAYFSFRVTRINERLMWWTGAQESHSEMMVRLEAHKQGIPVLWWDYSDRAAPPRQHGNRDRMAVIRVGLRPHERKKASKVMTRG